MIFKRLFQAKHLSEDPAVRLAAIDALDLDKVKDKQALHELAFNDSDASVSLAALAKLNSFALWLKASETAENKRIKKQAHEWVLMQINDPQSAMISNDEFDRFIGESKNTALLEEVLFSNSRLQNNDALALATLLKIDKANTTRLYYREHANDAQRQVIIGRVDDANELSKLLKLSSSASANQSIEHKLAILKERAEKPQKIKQAATLAISKLLALKEQHDYDYIFEHKALLNEEFNKLKSEFSFLDENDAMLLAEKFLRVNETAEKRLLDLKDEWQSTNELKQTTNALAEIEGRFAEVKIQVDAILASIDDPSLTAQSKLLANALADIASDCTDAKARPQTVAHKRRIKALDASIAQYQEFLETIPQAKAKTVEARELLKSLQTISHEQGANELKIQVSDLESQWKSIVTELKVTLPSELSAEWKEEIKKHRAAINEHVAAVKQQEKKLLAKLKTVQRMVEQGNFKPAIATFRHCPPLFDSLSDKGKRYHQKRFDEVAEKISELQSLQAFIAGPRKPALIEQITAMIAQEAEIDISARSAQVKLLRKEWNALGRLGTEEDDALNTQFDELLEQAFAPCRVYYAEQDKVRAANAVTAKEMITELVDLLEHQDLATLGRKLSAVNKKWKALGVLEHSERQSLNKEYYAALKPIQAKLDQFYASNAEQKQALVKRAEKLSDVEDTSEAAEQAKRLQQQWKTIPFAGRPTDDKLWQQFRKANDAVFARVNEKRDAQTNAVNAIKQDIVSITGSLSKAIEEASDSSELSRVEESINQARTLTRELPEKAAKAELFKLDKFDNEIRVKNRSLATQRSRSQWEALFTVLSQWEKQDAELSPELLSSLPIRFHSWVKNISNESAGSLNDRKSLTIQLEILTELASNKADEKLRKELQLSMMAAKLEGSGVSTVEETLMQWVAHGPLQKTDSALLKRVKKAFEQYLASSEGASKNSEKGV